MLLAEELLEFRTYDWQQFELPRIHVHSSVEGSNFTWHSSHHSSNRFTEEQKLPSS
jgi:hypothetical protein